MKTQLIDRNGREVLKEYGYLLPLRKRDLVEVNIVDYCLLDVNLNEFRIYLSFYAL